LTIRIAMWSGPRNLSTALMRSFGSRGDTVVTDEPFYGAFLKQSGADQAMREEVIASMNCDWASIARTLSGPSTANIWYQKHMAHHMIGPVDYDDLPGFAHAFLIRDPTRVIASYAKKRVTVTLDDLGLARQQHFFDREANRLGHAPPVVDSADVLADPEAILSCLCAALGIPWDPAMLCWEAGGRQTDGIWAAHWYGQVLQSTSFEAPPVEEVKLDDQQAALADQCRPYYDYLQSFCISR
jgi:Sulfotransferase domain